MGEPLRRRVRAKLLSGSTRMAGVVPRPLVSGTLRGLGRIAARGRYGRVTRNNLELAFGSERSPADLDRIARGVFRHAARQLGEWMRLAHGAQGPAGAWIDEIVTIDATIERLVDVGARGRGAIVVTAHIGNWELLCAALRRSGLEGAVVGRKRERDSSAQWLIEMRRAYGIETLPQDSPPRKLIEVLDAGGILGLLADLEVRRLDGEFLPFLGTPALTMTAPAALARVVGVPLVPVRCVAIDDEHYRLSVEEPLEFDRDRPRRDATIELSERLNEVYGRWIRATPEQWAWHQPRWRTRPGEFEASPIGSVGGA
ncbi:MAG: hypothetical protein GY711_14945 [bacterium]|nr:hypothetical protein [bacterium]